MKIGGLQKLTLIDYPEKPACTVFLAGCNLSCPWCHSPDLVVDEKIKTTPKIEKKDFFEFLKQRKNVLEGVVICGGEPTVNKELPEFIIEIIDLGYKVKLDTNGTNPKMLKELIEKDLLDYVAMDIKGPLEEYEKVTGVSVNPKILRESISIIKKIENYEFRTTLIPGVHDLESVSKIAKEIEGVQNYYLQNFRGKVTVDNSFQGKEGFEEEFLKKAKEKAEEYVKNCKIR